MKRVEAGWGCLRCQGDLPGRREPSECAAIQGREALDLGPRSWWDNPRFQLEIIKCSGDTPEIRTRAPRASLDKKSASGVYFPDCSCITTKKEQGLATEAKEGVWEEKGVEGKVGYILAAFLIRDGNRVGTRGERDKAQGLFVALVMSFVSQLFHAS